MEAQTTTFLNPYFQELNLIAEADKHIHYLHTTHTSPKNRLVNDVCDTQMTALSLSSSSVMLWNEMELVNGTLPVHVRLDFEV